jgi:regulatory protein
MGKITALRTGKGRSQRVSIYLDGEFAFSLDPEVVAREGLQTEQSLSAERVEVLVESDQHQRCLSAATRYLSYRPRSESELRDRLRRRGFDAETMEPVISRLKEQGLVDDAAFARYWAENRESFSPRSRWLTRVELRQKGITDDIIAKAVNVIDDEASAYKAALSKAHSLRQLDYEDFRRRLGEYLKRRGFSYGVLSHAVEQVWQDQKGGDSKPETE